MYNTPINENLTLTSIETGLTFGTDAYLLSAYLRKKPNGRAADLGAGTGVIALLCASRDKFAHIDCVELQPKFADLIAHNARENGLSGKIGVTCADVRDITADTLGGELDAAFANPPYLRENTGFVSKTDEMDMARRETAGGIEDFALSAARILKHGGLFTVVFRADRVSELLSALTGAHLEPKRMTLVYASRDHVPSLVLVEAKKGAGKGIFVTKPLILTENGTESVEHRYIYENACFPKEYFEA